MRGLSSDAERVTKWLALWREGDADAVNALFPVVYRELRALASRRRRGASAVEGGKTCAGTRTDVANRESVFVPCSVHRAV